MSETTRYEIKVEGDFLSKQTKSAPVPAVAELIWNSLDADASKVSVFHDHHNLDSGRFIVEDNGAGIPISEAPNLFSSLGGSWKKQSQKTKGKGRFLHGSEGKGRFKAFALGRVVEWEIVYRDQSDFLKYSVVMKDGETAVEVSSPEKCDSIVTGTRCIVSELHKEYKFLDSDASLQSFSEIFAMYLKSYVDVAVDFNGKALNPSTNLVTTKNFLLDDFRVDGKSYRANLEIVEWRNPTERVLYLCNAQGHPLSRTEVRIHAPGFNFSAYLKSDYITSLSHEGTLELGELAPHLKSQLDQARDITKKYYRERLAQKSKNVVDQWKAEEIYPYQEKAKSKIEEIEREVFDIVAVQVNDLLPDFSASSATSRKFQLRILKQALEKNPEELELILGEVLNLNESKQKEFAALLRETSLSSIINASKVVVERLKTLSGIEKFLFDKELKKDLKERSQLHRLLAENTWIFGEEFNLTVDDQSLTEVLRQHVALTNSELIIDRAVTTTEGKKGIVDLMFSKSAPSHRVEEHDHLIVELKRPTVKIDSDAVAQVKKYANAVVNDSRFASLSTRWTFWVLANEMDDVTRNIDARQSGAPAGRLIKMESPNITVWGKTWSEIIDENRARLGFFQKQLAYKADNDESVQYLRDRYASILGDPIPEES